MNSQCISLAFFLLFGCIENGATAAQEAYTVYVTNEVSGDITAIDGDALTVSTSFHAGKRPRGIEISPDGKEVLVALSGSPRMGPGADPERAHSLQADKSADGIAVFERASGKRLRTLLVGSDPEEFALSADGRRVFVANEDQAELSAWDITSGKNIWVAHVSEGPEGVAVHPTRPEVWVGCEAGGDIYVVDTQTGAALAHVVVGGRPRSIAFSPHGDRAYVALEGEGSVALLDVAARRLDSKIKFEPNPTLPMGVAVLPDGRTVLVTTGRTGKLALVDLATKTTSYLEVGQRPWGVVLSPDGKRAFTANGPSNDVSVIELASQKEVARIKVGAGPWGVAIGRN